MPYSEELLNRVRNITSSTLRQIENSSNVDRDNLDFCIRQFDQIVRHLQHFVNVDSPIADEVAAILLSIETISETLENSVNGNRLSIQLTLEYSGTGKPKLNVSYDHIYFLLQNGFKSTIIAKMLQISLRILRRPMSEYGITQQMFQSTITELELDDKVRGIVRYFPQIGYRRLLGELERQSIRITRSKARESLQRIDPVGVTERRLQGSVSRRKYNVKGPLSLWHIDGNHKLIRYVFHVILMSVSSASTQCSNFYQLLQ